MTNLNSLTELTEFVPLSPEIKQSSVTTIFSKIFKFSEDSSSESHTRRNDGKTTSPSFYVPVETKDTPAGDWNSIDPGDKDDVSLSPSVSEQYQFPTVIETRNLPNILHRVSSLLALRNKVSFQDDLSLTNSPAYKDTNLKQYWMPDSVSKECYECGEKFTTFRRKHHCRVCGHIFCSQCCNQEVPGKIIRCSGNLRVCTYCCKVVLSYLQSADIEADLSADLKALQDDLQSKFGNDYTISSEDAYSPDTQSLKSVSVDNRRKVSVIYQEEKFAAGGGNESAASRKSELSSLNTLINELVQGENCLQVQNFLIQNTKYESCFTGSQLIDWLIGQRKTTSRTHSLAICQVLLDAKYIENVSTTSANFVDGAVLYRFCNVTDIIDKAKETTATTATTTTASYSKSLQGTDGKSSFSNAGFHLDLNIHKNTAHITRQPQKNFHTKDKKKFPVSTNDELTDEVLQTFAKQYLKLVQINPVYWAHVDERMLREDNNERSTFCYLNDTFQQHLQNTVNQLLALENLSLSWSPIVISLAEQALKEIKLDCTKTDVISIGHYVQVKKLPGGERKDSQLVRGLVCSKNVAHKEMSTALSNPRILLLQCAIVYQRVEGRLMSLEPVMMQEQEYLRHAVKRIAALKPDLVLVHRNVSRLAQESLNALGITLVLNVKMQVMERIARCTNADILTAVDAYFETTQLGTCALFYTRDYTLKNGETKTLMFFEGCAFPQLGCTILLRGTSNTDLKKLKKVVNSIIFMSYNAKLEKSFLLDEFANPPTVPSFTFVEEIVSPKRSTAAKRESDVTSVSSTEKEPEPSKTSRRAERSDLEKNAKNDPEKAKQERKSDSEEKRTSTKSVVVYDDPLRLQADTQDDDIFKSESHNLSFKEVPLKQNKFRSALQDTVLSYSPYIVFNLPYLETKSGRNCELRKYFPKEIYYSEHISDNKDINRNTVCESTVSFKSAESSNLPKKPAHSFVLSRLNNDMLNEQVQTSLALYRACGGRYIFDEKTSFSSAAPKSCTTSKPVEPTEKDILDPRNHQRLSVLFCSFSHFSNNAPEFCVHPWIVNMDFYGCNDIPLGSFLERYCFRKSYMCPSETCETSMIDHERRFVHDTGCIHITLRELESLPEQNLPILFWSCCTSCKALTPITAMSSDTWSLSFAKYLELRFHAGKYTCRVDTSCGHSLHHDFCQYFYYNNIIASFKYTDILLWEISLPPSVIQVQLLQINLSQITDQVKKWAVMGHEVFGSILEKLCLLDTDNINTIQGLKKHLNKEQAAFKQKVDDIQVALTSSSLTDNVNSVTEAAQKDYFKLQDSLVLMKKSVTEVLSNWNDIFLKLDSRKRDDRQKSKSVSTELIENISPNVSFAENHSSEDESGKNDAKDESNLELPFHNEADDVPSKGDSFEQKSLDKDDGKPSLLGIMTSNDALSTASQSQTPDKVSVKTLLSQFLLPNTFQQNVSLLNNPISSDEHYLLNATCFIPIVVYDTEPSSIIACALSTYYYQNALENIAKSIQNLVEQPSKASLSKKESSDGSVVSSTTETPLTGENEEAFKFDCIDDGKSRSTKIDDTNHIEIQFSDSSANFTVKSYFAQQFKELRSSVFPAGEEAYVRSLSRCVHWAAGGGKSGSSFCKTGDDRFILKEMSRLELQQFLEFAPHYFNFIHSCYVSRQPTLLGKIVGVYRIKSRNSVTNLAFQSNLLVMENLFYTRDIIRKFDLKGSVRNRLVNTKSCHDGELVLLDENFINMTCESPLYIYPHSKTVLMQAINNDVAFLASQSVMDYSLLVGLDEMTQELVVGIIDYIRTFTWDKKLETIVKKSGLLGGQGKLPTIISPEEYKSRFIAAMHKYFLAVPDQWLGFGKGFDY